MKKLFLVLITLIVTSYTSLAYDYTNKELAPIGYNLNISPEVKALLENVDPDILSDNKAQTKFRFLIYFAVENYMKSKGVTVLNYQCFGKKASLDSYGFPKLLAHSANKTGVAKFYFKLDVDLLMAKPVDVEKQGAITVKMILTSYKSSSIIPLEKIDTEVTTEIIVDNNFLENFKRQQDTIPPHSLMAAVDATADKLTKIMVQK